MKAVAYARAAIKSLKAMPKKDREAVMDKMADYAAGGQQDVKRLQGSDLFRLCHGNWRAVFSQDGTVLAVLNVAKRGEVYR